MHANEYYNCYEYSTKANTNPHTHSANLLIKNENTRRCANAANESTQVFTRNTHTHIFHMPHSRVLVCCQRWCRTLCAGSAFRDGSPHGTAIPQTPEVCVYLYSHNLLFCCGHNTSRTHAAKVPKYVPDAHTHWNICTTNRRIQWMNTNARASRKRELMKEPSTHSHTHNAKSVQICEDDARRDDAIIWCYGTQCMTIASHIEY